MDKFAIQGYRSPTENNCLQEGPVMNMNFDKLNPASKPSARSRFNHFAWALIVPLVCLMLGGGCSTTQSDSHRETKGTRQVFPATFTTVWEAALGAAYTGDLLLTDYDRKTGEIWATRHIDAGSFGERVTIRVTSVTPTETAVEVESHWMGPPFLTTRNWEKPVLKNITFMLDE
jgi:hypothetical protein